jgi:hypothetical protein
MAFSCFIAAALLGNVPRLRRRPVLGSFFTEYSRKAPDFSLRIISLPGLLSYFFPPGTRFPLSFGYQGRRVFRAVAYWTCLACFACFSNSLLVSLKYNLKRRYIKRYIRSMNNDRMQFSRRLFFSMNRIHDEYNARS